MGESFEYEEYRTTLPEEFGFECTFYEGLSLATLRLRESLYISVEVDGREVRMGIAEHFPRVALAFYPMHSGGAFGKGAATEVVFRCYSPDGSGSAAEGVNIIHDTLGALGKRLALKEWPRSLAAMRDGARYMSSHSCLDMTRPYRPPAGALPERPAKPPAVDKLSRATRGISEGVRDLLDGWGLLDEYDQQRAARAARHPAIAERPNTWPPEGFVAPWAPPAEPEWLERWRELDTQMMGGKHA